MNVGILIIGNEILSGSVADTNSTYLAKQVFASGASLKEIATIPDDKKVIAAKVREFSDRFDLVFTTGGIGPTHDDITYQSVALAFGLGTLLHPELERVGRKFKGEVTPAVLKLITVPEGAEPLVGGDFIWPPMRIENVVILPGIPSLIERQRGAWRGLLPNSRFEVQELKVFCREIELAPHAEAVDLSHESVELGSYPKIHEKPFFVLLRFTGRTRPAVDAAVTDFLSRLDPGTRTEA